MDPDFAAAVPQFHHGTRGQVSPDMSESRDKGKIRRNAIILALIAIAFYVAFIASVAGRG